MERIVSVPFDQRGSAMSFPLFAELDADWCAVVASQGARDALARWSDDPPLRDAQTLDEVLARTARGSDRMEADLVLRALMVRAPLDEIAARTVLQAVIPGLVSVARRVGARENPDLEAEIATVAWTEIRGGRLTGRRGSIAGQLLLDVFHVVSRLRRNDLEHPVAPADLARFAPLADDRDARRPDGREVLELVARSGRVPPEQLRLISDAVLDRLPVSVAAHRAGVSVKAMTRRRERARASVIRAYDLPESA
jgi:hypothetical protein